MANWSNPTLTSTYTNFVTEVKDRDTDCATFLDGSTSTNLPTGAKRWNSTTNKFEKWSGTAWSDMATTYAIGISGNAANVTGVVAALNGGTGQSSYAIGDLLYASTTTALSKLADVAAGNALISGGVGVAPAYGKIGLTTHVSGTLPVANGGTGATSSTGSGSVVLATSPTFTTSAISPLLIGGTGTTSALVLRSTSGVGVAGADILFQVGNNGATEAMRVLNNGNVGIGTASAGSPLTVYAANNQAAIKVTNGASANNAGITLESLGGNVVLNNGNGPFELSVGGSLRAVVTTAGNVGLGTGSPSYRCDVQTSTAITQARFSNSATGGATITSTNTGQAIWAAGSEYNGSAYVARSTVAQSIYADAGYISFTTNTGLTSGNSFTPTERMRIDASGNLMLGTTANFGSNVRMAIGYAGAGTQYGIEMKPAADSTYAMYFRNAAGTGIGGINCTSTDVTYLTFSDYRLKENVKPMIGALAKVAALNPVIYTWRENGAPGQGFIAHELQSVVPEAVIGQKDEVDAQGKPAYQGIDPSKIIGLLTAAIQELKAEIDALKAMLPSP